MKPELEFVLEAEVAVGEAIELGPGPAGVRRCIPITGGTFRGPDIEGLVLPGGADWQIVRADGVVELEARYVLETADQVRIGVVNRCLRHGPPEVMAALKAGEPVAPGSYYFRTNPTFAAPDGRYGWLNKSLFVGSGERHAGRVIMRIWRVA